MRLSMRPPSHRWIRRCMIILVTLYLFFLVQEQHIVLEMGVSTSEGGNQHAPFRSHDLKSLKRSFSGADRSKDNKKHHRRHNEKKSTKQNFIHSIQHPTSESTQSIPTFNCSILNKTINIPMIPNFIIAGAQKSGTTALSEFLRQHPNIQSSNTMEPHFFDWYYPSDVQKEEWLVEHSLSTTIDDDEFRCALHEDYAKNFNMTPSIASASIPSQQQIDHADDDVILSIDDKMLYFEKTPSYLFLWRVPGLIHSLCFWKPKIIIILRNPIDRAFSHYRMGVRTKGKSFDQLIDDEVQNLVSIGLSHAPIRMTDTTQNEESSLSSSSSSSTSIFGTTQHHSYDVNDPGFDRIPNLSQSETEKKHWKHYRKMFTNNFLQRGMYIIQLRHWMRYFPLNESLLVLQYEKFKSHPKEVYSQILDFVGVPSFIPATGFGGTYNAMIETNEVVSNSTRRYLSSLFRPYNNHLADLLGEDWRGIWD